MHKVCCSRSGCIFSCVFFLYIWLCLWHFACVCLSGDRDFFVPRVCFWLCLWLTSIYDWLSTIPSVFFLFVPVVLWHLICWLSMSYCCCISCCVVSVVLTASLHLFGLIVSLYELHMHCLGSCIVVVVFLGCFCCVLGAVGGVAFFSWWHSVVMRVSQCLLCALLCLNLPTYRFPWFHNTNMHPSNPSVCICTLFTRTHVVLSVFLSVRVFVYLMVVLCVCVWSCLWLLVCLCLCFAFVYVSFVVLCTYTWVYTMCLVFVCVFVYGCILLKIRVFR